MALHPTGSDRLLEVRTAYVDLVIKSKGKQTRGGVKNEAGSSSLKVLTVDVEGVSVPVYGMSEEYHEHAGYGVHDYWLEPLFFEQTDYVVTIKARHGEALEFRSNSPLVEERIAPVLDDDPTLLSGVVNFGNNVGFSDFTVLAGGKTLLSLRLEVYPSKITYKEDYQAMMADINDMVSESVLDFMKKTYQVFVPDHKRNEVPAVFFTILQTIYDKYIQAVKRIISVPHHKLISEHEVVPCYRARRTDGRSEKWLQKHPECLVRKGDRILADRVLSVRKQITYDTQENRLVRFMLRSTVRRIHDFRGRYVRSTQNPDRAILAGAGKMEQELQRLLSDSFLSEVSEYSAAQSMSLVFGMAPGYRELYKYYLMLQNGISVGGDIFRMSVRETAQLYEYWCFIKLYAILKEHYQLKSPDIIKVDRKGVTVDLVKGRPSRITFLNTQTGELFYLAYNPAESKTQTVNQKPDNVLELEKRGSKTAYKYIFDAKYRIESKPDGVFYPDTRPGPKVDDINTMHRYRDSIVYENPDSRFTFEKTMFGAYILFPYGDEEEYRDHRFYKSIESVNIGGLPFLPSATTLVTQLLDALITDSSESAFERATLPAGIEEKLSQVDWKRRDVLIGTFRSREQFRVCLEEKFYYMPVKQISDENLPIHYVAMFQTPRVFSGEGGIYYYGEVLRTALVRRRSITEVPGYGDPEELYYRFAVREWIPLEKPIQPKEAAFVRAFTNRFLLDNAEYVPELLLGSEEEYRLYTELKRRTGQALQDNEDAPGFELDGVKVMFENGRIILLSGDAIVGSCSIQEFSRHPNATFRHLLRLLGDRRGGELDPPDKQTESE